LFQCYQSTIGGPCFPFPWLGSNFYLGQCPEWWISFFNPIAISTQFDWKHCSSYKYSGLLFRTAPYSMVCYICSGVTPYRHCLSLAIENSYSTYRLSTIQSHIKTHIWSTFNICITLIAISICVSNQAINFTNYSERTGRSGVPPPFLHLPYIFFPIRLNFWANKTGNIMALALRSPFVY